MVCVYICKEEKGQREIVREKEWSIERNRGK